MLSGDRGRETDLQDCWSMFRNLVATIGSYKFSLKSIPRNCERGGNKINCHIRLARQSNSHSRLLATILDRTTCLTRNERGAERFLSKSISYSVPSPQLLFLPHRRIRDSVAGVVLPEERKGITTFIHQVLRRRLLLLLTWGAFGTSLQLERGLTPSKQHSSMSDGRSVGFCHDGSSSNDSPIGVGVSVGG